VKEIAPLKKQLIKFTLTGILAVIVDLTCYYILLNVLPERVLSMISNEAFAKAVSFICGMTVTYTLNKFWTWNQNNHSRKSVLKFALFYGLSLIVNVVVNSVLLFMMHEYASLFDLPYKYVIAFVGATGVSASLNFIGQKFWVFKSIE
jgi:putative flippase GtrA